VSPIWVTVPSDPDPGEAPVTAVRPTVSDVAELLYVACGPMRDGDEEQGWPLLHLCHAVSLPGAEVDEPAGGDVGWSTLLDVDTAPAKALRWLGQFVGVAVPATASEALARGMVRARQGWGRGTPAAMVAAAQLWLTGTQQVTLSERSGGDPYAVEVTVYGAEVVDLARLTAAVTAAKPAGILLTLTVLAGRTFAEAETEYTGMTFAEVEAAVAPATFAEEERKVPTP
jgi:hypothetical protein